MISTLGAVGLGDLNVQLKDAVDLMKLIADLLDLIMKLPFGLLGLKAQLMGQLSGMLSAAASIGVTTPFDAIKAMLAQLLGLVSQLELALKNPASLFGVTINASMIASGAAAVEAQLGGLNGLIDQILALLGRLNALVALILGKFSVGAVNVYVGTGEDPAILAGELVAQLAIDFPPPRPTAKSAKMLVILTESPGVWTSLGSLLKTA